MAEEEHNERFWLSSAYLRLHALEGLAELLDDGETHNLHPARSGAALIVSQLAQAARADLDQLERLLILSAASPS